MRYLEDFSVGEKSAFGRYEVTREEVIAFASKYDPQPFHLDDEAAAKHPFFGRLSASGWHTCGMAMRMMVEHWTEQQSPSLGSPGVDELRWLKPVYPGDTLRMEGEIIEVRPSQSRPEMGSVRTRYTLFNQHDEPVMRFIGIGLFARGPA